MTKKPAKKIAAKKAAKKLPSSPQALAAEMMRLLTQHLGPDELIMPEGANSRSGILPPPARIHGSLKTKARTST
jgi:hypothetical protein